MASRIRPIVTTYPNTPRGKILKQFNPRIQLIRRQKSQMSDRLKNANGSTKVQLKNRILTLANQIALLTVQRNRQLQNLGNRAK